jgi:peptidoglycan/LPS O-acetylase OafA/YrhL
MLFTGLSGAVALNLPVLYWATRNGYQGVAVFIVLSGFVLMLAVSKTGKAKLPKGFGNFIWRRFRRIVPPYWVALILSLLLIWSMPIMQVKSGTKWDGKLGFDWQGIAAHVFLIHDFIPEWMTKINGPMWSVAVEWHIYFLMPLLILPLWRWFGKWVALGVVLVIGYLPLIIAEMQNNHHLMSVPAFISKLDRVHPWYIALFAIGMLGAEILTNTKIQAKLFWIPFVVVFAGLFTYPDLAQSENWLSELLVGISTVMLVIWLALRPKTLVYRFLSTKPILGLGKMSYSLYLVHSPLLALGNLILLQYGLPLGVHALWMFGVVLPLAITVAFVFYWLVERHFMTSHQKALIIR